MNRLLISVCVAMALPALAQAQAIGSAPSKPAAAAKKAAAPAPAAAAKKPKVVVMTRDQLRACLKAQQANSAENKSIDVEKEDFSKERQAIVADKEVTQKQANTLDAQAKAIMALGAELQEGAKEFANPVPKEKAKEMEAKRIAFNDRIGEHQIKVDAYNADKQAFNATKEKLDARIEANNARGRALMQRTEKYNDSVDEWKTDCANKPYDTNDEAAVKKELGL